jgi:hypothetical protein
MAIGAKFIDVIPSSVENAADVKKEDVKNYLFVGIPMSEFIGNKHEFEGYIFMCLQGITGGTELGGDIAIAVLRPVRPAVGQASYHLVSYTPLTYTRSDVAILLRNGDFKVVKRDDCNLI